MSADDMGMKHGGEMDCEMSLVGRKSRRERERRRKMAEY